VRRCGDNALTLRKPAGYSFLELEPPALRSEPRWFGLLWVENLRLAGCVARVLGVRAALMCWQRRRRGRGGSGCQALDLAGQLASDARERLHQLDSSALGSGRAEDGLGVLEPGV
jgi:hypothetical protein